MRSIIKLFYRRPTIKGLDHVDQAEPAVFISNHLDTYGPIILELFFPLPFRPWVHANLVSPELCREHLEMNFTRKILKLKPPLSRWIASVIAPVCIGIMKSVDAIPVYRGQMKVRDTLNISVESLNHGKNIVIFPENPNQKYSEFLGDFHRGFVHLARQYAKRSGRQLRFYPVYVNKRDRTIEIGQPVIFDSSKNFRLERDHIISYLRDSINEIAMKTSR